MKGIVFFILVIFTAALAKSENFESLKVRSGYKVVCVFRGGVYMPTVMRMPMRIWKKIRDS